MPSPEINEMLITEFFRSPDGTSMGVSVGVCGGRGVGVYAWVCLGGVWVCVGVFGVCVGVYSQQILTTCLPCVRYYINTRNSEFLSLKVPLLGIEARISEPIYTKTHAL